MKAGNTVHSAIKLGETLNHLARRMILVEMPAAGTVAPHLTRRHTVDAGEDL